MSHLQQIARTLGFSSGLLLLNAHAQVPVVTPAGNFSLIKDAAQSLADGNLDKSRK
jgi:hypothetical protein